MSYVTAHMNGLYKNNYSASSKSTISRELTILIFHS